MMATIEELIQSAAMNVEPAITAQPGIGLGGVDPLGIRQINFNLMDAVFPGINNTANHIRPFTIVSWAWRRAVLIAQMHGLSTIKISTMEDFVARIEVIYVWSQFLKDTDADLPGHDVLAPLLNLHSYTFGGSDWENRKKKRADSTALSAPANYGPALKNFRWLQTAKDGKGALVSTEIVEDALTALDAAMAQYLNHPAFSAFGSVTVSTAEVAEWGAGWALDEPSDAERRTMARTLAGDLAPTARRDGVALVLAAHRHSGGSASVRELRRIMCGMPSDFLPPPPLQQAQRNWRALQVRQAFRLALEVMLAWVCWRLESGPAETRDLAREFLLLAGEAEAAGAWLEEAIDPNLGPVEWLDALDKFARSPERLEELPRTIRTTLAHCLAEAPSESSFERLDRLPLSHAAREASGWRSQPALAFVSHVFDAWVLGQHVYWAIGRGLGDARAGSRTLLRLKVSLEEAGWTPIGTFISAPRATPDRLATILSLMGEAGMLFADRYCPPVPTLPLSLSNPSV